MTPIRPAVPAFVRRHAERAVGDVPPPARVRISQVGEMWLKPGSRAMRFTAVQGFEIEKVAFAWCAHFPLFGPVALHVVDRFSDGAGELAVRLFGLPLQRQRGSETAEGEALRYLAELPWAPHALLHNRELEWRELDDRRVEVATRVGEQRVTATLQANTDGDLVHSHSETRRRRADGRWLATPWGGNFGAYEALGGLRIPTDAEAYWELPEGRYVYFRGRVTALEVVPKSPDGGYLGTPHPADTPSVSHRPRR